MSYHDPIVSLSAEDAAKVAELLLAVKRAADIPKYLRSGNLPEALEVELQYALHAGRKRQNTYRGRAAGGA